MKKIVMPIGKKLFLSHFLAVLLVSGSIGTYFYLSAYESLLHSLKSRLQSSAAMISQALDARDLSPINHQEDQSLPVYRETLGLLRSIKKTNPDIAFLYLMRQEGNRVFFVVDSDETRAQALPGREYKQTIPALWEGFSRPAVDDKIFEDDWGAFMSGYAPLKNGNGAYLVGLDMRADEVQRKFQRLQISGLLSLVASVLLALLFSRWLSSHFKRPIKQLVSRCSAIAEGKIGEKMELRTGDELDHLIKAFNTMTEHLEDSRDRNRWAQSALKKGQEELERRVEERTRELQGVNDQLREEITRRQKTEEALARVARSDPLTGLMNRRAMMYWFQYQLKHYQRNRIPFAVLLCDIDHFKQVNDTYGHAVGDLVLRDMAEFLKESLRSQDLLARWGGEEFLILLPDTDEAGGAVVAEKIRSRIEKELFRDGSREFRLSLSFGVAAYQPEQSADDCIKAADAAMYRAKNSGRNRVEMANGPKPGHSPSSSREEAETSLSLNSSESSILRQAGAV
ncbi:MAG: diguanylate cyclase [Deltaproteobacteria bacterium]|nr:diguanylate cyclase [Deltaproteobacteria bacterium]